MPHAFVSDHLANFSQVSYMFIPPPQIVMEPRTGVPQEEIPLQPMVLAGFNVNLQQCNSCILCWSVQTWCPSCVVFHASWACCQPLLSQHPWPASFRTCLGCSRANVQIKSRNTCQCFCCFRFQDGRRVWGLACATPGECCSLDQAHTDRLCFSSAGHLSLSSSLSIL